MKKEKWPICNVYVMCILSTWQEASMHLAMTNVFFAFSQSILDRSLKLCDNLYWALHPYNSSDDLDLLSVCVRTESVVFGEFLIWWLACRVDRRQIEHCFQPWCNPLWLTRLKIPTNQNLLSEWQLYVFSSFWSDSVQTSVQLLYIRTKSSMHKMLFMTLTCI